ncbi:MAG: methylenetetrahydrofolate reductase [Schwartzia sp.]|nr:methylenetetrahydrofolate reductase [NAD(P)H] [Schwartzia sp. (in: firmicutes)]
MPASEKRERAIFSFEIFPPKRDMPIDTVYRTLDELTDLEPDFISVTCGAGGSADGSNYRTIEVASAIQNKYRREGIAHLPCIHFTRADVIEMLDKLEENGVRKILALRGDRVLGLTPKEDFHHASDLVGFIRALTKDRFQIFAACYPEGHTEAPDLDTDIRNLRRKVDAGVDRLISQLFFDNEFFYEFLDKARNEGITVPIEAGIMPITNKKQIERMVTLCGATLPRKFQRVLAKYESQPEALRDAGIAFATEQIVDLLAHGVDGIHLYTMNNPYIARKISETVRTLL